ncbi:glycosyltransferase family 4 protein [Melioribacter sp. Ez-97]|uniref:glycosyltransferase family 4 protein n=1 Tax=Melioribacter sp. Ez-97 TaxID=3423434 RepID=UPI003ED94E47
MRVCFIGRYYHEYVTAPVKYSRALRYYIFAEGVEHIFITYFFDCRSILKKLTGYEKLESGVIKCGTLRIALKLFEYKTDLIHFTTLERFEIPLFIFAKLKNIKIVSTLHGLFFEESKNDKPYGRLKDLLLERIAIKFSDLLLIYSQYQAEKLTSKYNIRRAKIRFIHNGVESVSSKDEKQNFASAFRILFYKGFGNNDRGLKQLTEILADIRGPQLLLTVLSGSERKTVQKTENLIIVYEGFIQGKEMNDLFKEAHIVIKMPFFETFSTFTLEAMSYGVVPVVPDFIGVSRFITNGKNGLKYHSKSPPELRELIQKIVCGNYNLKLLSANARETAIQFTWEKAARNTKEFYEEIIR